MARRIKARPIEVKASDLSLASKPETSINLI